jgi:integrase
MPSLIKRNSGIYTIVSYRKGKRPWQSTHTRDHSEAAAIFQEHIRQHPANHLARISTYFHDRLEGAALDRRSKTIEIYRRAFGNFLRICGDLYTRNVTPYHIEQFKRQRAKEVSPVSANIELRALLSAFREATRLRVISSNPCEGTKLLNVPPKEQAHLSEIELQGLMSVIEDSELRDIITFTVQTLARISEVTNLRWVDVDLVRREIHLRSHDNFHIKGGKPRIVPMSDWVHLCLSGKEKASEYVFLNTRGRQFSAKSLSKRFKKFVRKAGLSEAIHFHSLRHTGVSYLLNRGVPAPFVSACWTYIAGDDARIYPLTGP